MRWLNSCLIALASLSCSIEKLHQLAAVQPWTHCQGARISNVNSENFPIVVARDAGERSKRQQRKKWNFKLSELICELFSVESDFIHVSRSPWIPVYLEHTHFVRISRARRTTYKSDENESTKDFSLYSNWAQLCIARKTSPISRALKSILSLPWASSASSWKLKKM